MQECYVMQNQTQEQKTKNNGHKEKSNEAQGPRKPRQIKDMESHQLLDEEFQNLLLSRDLVKMSAF